LKEVTTPSSAATHPLRFGGDHRLVKAGWRRGVGGGGTSNARSGASFVTRTLVPDWVLTGAYQRSFRLAPPQQGLRAIRLDPGPRMGIDGFV